MYFQLNRPRCESFGRASGTGSYVDMIQSIFVDSFDMEDVLVVVVVLAMVSSLLRGAEVVLPYNGSLFVVVGFVR